MAKAEGLLGFYGLQEWWLSSFAESERAYIDDCYQPMGGRSHALTRGTFSEVRLPAAEFLNGLNTWFRSCTDSTIAERIHKKISELGEEHPITKPGYYNGRHFTTWVRDFEILKKNGEFTELENLLIELVKATEAQSKVDGMGVAPAYYNELAILYRKQKDFSKEVAILERLARQLRASGAMPAKLLERMDKAKKLLASQPKTTK